MNSKKIGNEYEKKLCELLKDKKYWCHLLSYNSYGQPFDIIAFNRYNLFLIDAKHCKGDRFSFSNIEPNQISSFTYALECGASKEKTGFAIWFENDNCFKWLPFYKVIGTSIHKNELKNIEEVL